MSQRFIVKEASQMTVGEPVVVAMGRADWMTDQEARDRAAAYCADYNASRRVSGIHATTWGAPSGFQVPWAVVDTQDEWHMKDAAKPAKTKRYLFKHLHEMTLGEPTVCRGKVSDMQEWADDKNRGYARNEYPYIFGDVKQHGHQVKSEGWVVDLHDAWHRQSDFDPEEARDRMVVAAYEAWQREDDSIKKAHSGVKLASGGVATLQECRASWSRELKRKLKREKSKNRIVCEGTLPEDY